MKKIKLKLTVYQVSVLGAMLVGLFNDRVFQRERELEYYVLAEFYRRYALRFVYINDRPFQLTLSEAYALYGVMRDMRWGIPHAGDTATAILWQLCPKFETKKLGK
ncbi:MAG: hypothetical protein LBN98_03615 [Prevotellaceae bacterium]|jgi:hypothetical protein|nr:hypothetical protein [Prevotellaceae bacterium]